MKRPLLERIFDIRRKTVCDVCMNEIPEPDGFLLTTRQVVSAPAYWDYVLSHQLSYIEDLPNSDSARGVLIEKQANQSNPWIVCGKCAQMLGVDLRETGEYAKQWWKSGKRFAPPGSGPVPLSAVRAYRVSEQIDFSGTPRPSQVHVYGRGFFPSDEQVRQAIDIGLVEPHREILTHDLFCGIPIQVDLKPADTREIFIGSIERVKNQHPKDFVLDSMWSEPETLNDMVVLAIWEGAAAEVAKQLFAKHP